MNDNDDLPQESDPDGNNDDENNNDSNDDQNNHGSGGDNNANNDNNGGLLLQQLNPPPTDITSLLTYAITHQIARLGSSQFRRVGGFYPLTNKKAPFAGLWYYLRISFFIDDPRIFLKPYLVSIFSNFDRGALVFFPKEL